MKNSTLRFVLIVSLLLNISVLAAAGYRYFTQPGSRHLPFGANLQNGMFLFDELSLNPGQTRSLRAKATLFHAEIDQVRQEIAHLRKELIDRMRVDNPDRRAIDTTIKTISKKQEHMQRTVTLHMLDVKSELEKEQQKRFLDLIQHAMAEEHAPGCPPTGRQ